MYKGEEAAEKDDQGFYLIGTQENVGKFDARGFCDDKKSAFIYPKQFTVSVVITSHLDQLFDRDEDKQLSTKLHGKHDYFDFHIVHCPLLSEGVPSCISHCVQI